jgi:hypothetical protein
VRTPAARRAILAAVALAAAALTVPTAAGAGEGSEAATWALEQPSPPPPPPNVAPAPVPVGLGAIGDIEFWEPAGGAAQANRGLLITHGNGPAVPPGVWAYNGVRWHEIAVVCGASDGSVAWSAPEEFWTVSDGRPGQSNKNSGTNLEREVPLKDNTLCRFAEGRVADSYAHLAFEPDSYLEMHAAACVPPRAPAVRSEECWFGGALPEAPQVGGSFHLHWNGSSLEEEPDPEGHAVREMRQLQGAIFESVEVLDSDPEGELRLGPPSVVHVIEAGTIEAETGLPLYGPDEPAQALQALRLSSAEGALWGAAGPSDQALTEGQESGQVTVALRASGIWRQVFGPRHPLPEAFSGESEAEALTGSREARLASVTAFAAEPGDEDAWVALGPRSASEQQGRPAALLHIDAEGQVLGVQTLPSAEERAHGVGAKGSAVRMVCPAREDCWMATSEGWLYHLATSAERAAAASEADKSEMRAFPEGSVISERPRDQGIPQEVVEAPPADTSGVSEEKVFEYGEFAQQHKASEESEVALPLLSHVRDRVRGGDMLELSFHLSVRAQVQLLAKRGGKVVAKTAERTFTAGNRRLTLRLKRRAWPTKLSLKTHALEKLKVVSSVTGEGANVTTETTALRVLPRSALAIGMDRLP